VNSQRMQTPREPADGPIVYWMNRDQRVADNWALIHAKELADARRVPIVVVFCLTSTLPDATARQFDFMLSGLEEVERVLSRVDIPFSILLGDQPETVVEFTRSIKAGLVVTDFSPLRFHRKWKDEVSKLLSIPLVEVDAHNIVPCWVVSDKKEFSAARFRPKIQRLLPTFLDSFPTLTKSRNLLEKSLQGIDWKRVRAFVKVDSSVKPVDWLRPGEKAARKHLDEFIRLRLKMYDSARNDPRVSAQSGLSPYLHFGHISAQRIALTIMEVIKNDPARNAFLEELIVRRELSDNFCFYNPSYDDFNGFPSWSQQTLDLHRSDRRAYVFTRAQFEQGSTHDPLWNAAQRQMVRTGKMRGYMRMYWAKKILEWTKTPEKAMQIAVYLNDKYELDGCDPNGYTGIAWSIGGVHDRAWGERPVFGKIRYMNDAGCARKFDVKGYISAYPS